MKSSFKAKVKCAQLGLKYIGTGRGFGTAIESIGLLARWKAWPQRRPTQRAPDPRKSTETMVVGVGAFLGNFLGFKLVPSKLVPSKWRCLVPPQAGNASLWAG